MTEEHDGQEQADSLAQEPERVVSRIDTRQLSEQVGMPAKVRYQVDSEHAVEPSIRNRHVFRMNADFIVFIVRCSGSKR